MLLIAAILAMTLNVSRAANAAVEDRFGIEEYQLFYEVLIPLQREALPREDFQRIRLMRGELVARGKEIVKLRAAKWANPEFFEARRKFDRALNAFLIDARKDNNPRLVKSFTALHDSFEEFVAIAPTGYNLHPPPTIALSCSCSNPTPGEQLICRAYSTPPFDSTKRTIDWTLTAGKIISGQGTPSLTIDTTGQAGQKISVTVTVDDGNGHVASNYYQVEIATANKQP